MSTPACFRGFWIGLLWYELSALELRTPSAGVIDSPWWEVDSRPMIKGGKRVYCSSWYKVLVIVYQRIYLYIKCNMRKNREPQEFRRLKKVEVGYCPWGRKKKKQENESRPSKGLLIIHQQKQENSTPVISPVIICLHFRPGGQKWRCGENTTRCEGSATSCLAESQQSVLFAVL